MRSMLGHEKWAICINGRTAGNYHGPNDANSLRFVAKFEEARVVVPADEGSRPDDAPRLAAVVERQRRELDELRASATASTVIATAAGMLMERLGCTAAEAVAQLRRLASATSVPVAQMAATVVGTDAAEAGGAAVSSGALAGSADDATGFADEALAADGAAIAATLAVQVAPLGLDAVAVWLFTATGAMELLGESGLGEADAERWRHIPPQLDCPAQRVAHGTPDLWWEEGRPAGDGALVTGPPEAPRVVLALRERTGELLGVLELRWPADGGIPSGGSLADDVRPQLLALAAGLARVVAVRLAHGDLAAAEPRPALYGLLEQIAGSVLVVRAIRGPDGDVADFAIDYVSSGYVDPAGRPVTEITGLTLLEAYPPAVAGHRLFARALRVLEDGQPQYVAGPLIEPVPLADFRAARFADGVVFAWRAAPETVGLLDNVQRLGRLGGWEENLVNGTARWTDSAFEIFGLQPVNAEPIRIADLHSYVIAADKAAVRRLGAELSAEAGPEPVTATFRIVRPDDSSFRQIRLFAEPVADQNGTVTVLRGAFQDVSAHYLTQVALDATQDQLDVTRDQLAEEHLLALRLQRAILPPQAHPVEAAGIDVAVRYRPAGHEHLVGGDWYDTLVLPGGDVLLVVGDVAGHGIEAVTGMVAARNALRGLSVTGAGPAELMRMLNVTLCHLVSGVIGTVICGIYTPATRGLRWARAGHLPPVLLRDGTAAALPLPEGILLGMDPDMPFTEAVLQMQPGDTLLFFTDGLIERRGESIGDALGDFVSAAGTLPAGLPAARCADQMLISAASDTDDDACLVAIRIL
jgi:serine phosphatase RsbU (regulator of sigma subunit)/PAS domain-containing protein